MSAKLIEGGFPEHARFEPTFKRGAYYDTEYFNKELSNIWFKTWLCAGRVEEVPKTGDYITATIADENVIIIRSDDGSINTFFNVCRHRGSRLCGTEDGNFTSGFITCPYHSWMYDGSTGELVNAPNIPEDDQDFDKSERSLMGVKTEIWDGYIWINFDENAPDLKESFNLPASWKRYNQYDMKNLKLAEKRTYTVKANWKFIMENASECYHCGNIHPELSRVTPPSRARVRIDDDIPETEVVRHTGGMDIRRGFDRVNIDGKAYRKTFPGLDEKETRKIYYLHIYPHSFIGMAADYVVMVSFFPVSPEETIVQAYWMFEQHVVDNEEFIQDAIDFWDTTNKQDFEECELVHLGNRSIAYKDGGILTPTEWRTAEFKHYVQSKVESSSD
ncbi:aromatic ring-hydroxylating dioxygenase subunit alpha [Oceanobacillus sp. FSL K6-2867]|uniref:aromatic ring-hydroxylating oxygenase subunit alpha n=1 Tax=Oceanobacillus sp. FSL K6-2867 TaxID=2954748 RepID=UPI0030D6D0E9